MAAVRTISSSSSSSPILFFFFIILFLSCSHLVVSQSINEASFLLELKANLENTGALSSWKQGTDPCKFWRGVTCKNGTVLELRLRGLGLSGDFSAESITGLKSLRAINIASNKFTGQIPDFFRLAPLWILLIDNNQFSGDIPPDFFQKMRGLKRVNFASNKFTGKIPDSLAALPKLRDLNLQRNQFSGKIPELRQNSLQKLDLSFNKLEGQIPQGLEKFAPAAFAENPGLCSEKLGKKCPEEGGEPTHDRGLTSSAKTAWIILSIFILILVVTLFFKSKRKEHGFNLLRKEKIEDGGHMHMPSSYKKSVSTSRRRGGGPEDAAVRSLRGKGSRSRGARSVSELIIVNDERGTFGLPDLMKAAAEVLGNGGLGSAYKAVMSNGVSVVVKRLRDMNKLNRDDFDTEMRFLGRLKHKNILSPLAYHYRREEKLLVSEYVPRGSLLYLMHGDRGTAHSELTWSVRLKIIKGVAQGLGFLHSKFATYDLPHGNLKSSNILVATDFEPLLTDYAFYPLIIDTQSAQALFAYKAPEAVLYQKVSPKSDVFCLGIVILEVLTGKFPCQYMASQKGGTDIVQYAKSATTEKRESELIDPDIASGTSSLLKQMEKLLHIGVACTEDDHDKRVDLNEAIRRIETIQD